VGGRHRSFLTGDGELENGDDEFIHEARTKLSRIGKLMREVDVDQGTVVTA
jgi:hypothetical protein